jgi:hypothetical protein
MSIERRSQQGRFELKIHVKPLVAALVATTVALATGCQREDRAARPSEAQRPGRVLVFGIDGGTWDVMGEMIEDGELPHLAKLYREGIHGVLQSRNPALSPVVWSTIFTGRLPKDHGVEDWKTSQAQHRKVKALWEITSERDVDTNVFNVPSTFPPKEVRGVMISGFPLGGATLGGNTGVVVRIDKLDDKSVSPHHQYNATLIRKEIEPLDPGQWSPWFEVGIRGRPTWRAVMRAKRLADDKYYLSPIYRTDSQLVYTHPADLRSRLGPVLGDRPYIPEGPGWSKHAEPDTPEYLFEHLVQVSQIQSDAATSFASEGWQLFIYVNTLVDRVCHPYWAYFRPGEYEELPPERAERFAFAVKQSYREVDEQLGRLLAEVRGPTYVMLASDHGFHSNTPNPRQYIGTHDLAGIYLVAGPGLTGRAGGEANIEDIAPTALYLLGLPVADDMAGRVISEVRDALEWPQERIPSYETAAAPRGSDAPVDQETWEQLKGLGYVDGDVK